MRREIKLLDGRVIDLEQGWDIDRMRIFHAYDHPEETHSMVQCQQIVIEGLEQCVRE